MRVNEVDTVTEAQQTDGQDGGAQRIVEAKRKSSPVCKTKGCKQNSKEYG